MTLNDLSRLQREWAARIPGMRPAANAAPEGDGRLREVASFGDNPGALRMLAYVPEGLPPGAPLVVVLHGCGQTAAGYDAGTGWSALADRHGFALLFPEQQSANNAHGCFNWFEPGDTARGGGEVASIRSMVAHMVTAHGLDARRVYVTGLSAGGAMTAALLATYPGAFAGGAIIAGLPYGAAGTVKEALAAMYQGRILPAQEWGDRVRRASPASSHRPSVAIWHGTADTTVAPVNALELVKQWTDVHGLDATGGDGGVVDGIPHRAWRDAAGTVQVQLYMVPGLGHGAPIDPQAEGDRGVGQTMPFILDAAVSSTWRIARDWGLVEDMPRVAPATATPAQGPVSMQDIMAHTLRAAGFYGPK